MYLCLGVLMAACYGLVACRTLDKVSYDGPASVESSYSADVTLVSGAITGDPFVGFIYPIPIAISRPAPNAATFNVDDQRVFVASLIDELNRLKILSAREATETDGGKADVSIRVTFLHTHVRDTAVDTYALNVDLQMCARDRCTSERYDVNSSEGGITSSHLSITFAGAKERVAKKLLAKIIPGIEKVVAHQ
jgi:hypothetical protein